MTPDRLRGSTMNRKLLGCALALSLSLVYPAQASAPMKELSIPALKMTPKFYAEISLAKKGIGFQGFKCLSQLWTRESHWNHLADNPTSTAFGIAQMLTETSKSPRKQVTNGISYIFHRFSGPCGAYSHFLRHRWY